jgi:hypothetical protein
MKKIMCERFAIIKKGGQLVKPFVNEIPYLLFRRKMDAMTCVIFERPGTHKVVKVKVTIEVME